VTSTGTQIAAGVGNVTFRRSYWVLTVTVLCALGWLAYYHWDQVRIPILRTPVIILSFGWLIVILVAAHFNHPIRWRGTMKYKVLGVVPNHNEDPAMFRRMLDSLAAQTYHLHALIVVENGATNGECRKVFDAWATTQNAIPNVEMLYNPKPSKRHAQGRAWQHTWAATCDITGTIDGDVELAPTAVENGLRPFRDAHVMSVAGLLVGKNHNTNVLTRLVNLSFVSSFMNGRAAWSTFRSVAVNCGGLAFYRMHIVQQHLGDYLGQTLLGKEVNSGDDRILTGYAALHGKTVFQETCVGYTLLPENMGHLTRQRGRWWRSFWWGGVWLLRRFSPDRAIWWLVLSQYITFALYAVMIPIILLYDPLKTGHFPWEFFVYIAGLSYVRMARTLKVRRPDESTKAQVLTYLLGAPFVPLLNLWLCTILQFWGAVTFWETGWRTRKTVEVGVTG
jgi:hyaluronan synthase